MKKVMTVSLGLLGTAGLVFTLGFVNVKEETISSKAPLIIIEESGNYNFIDEDDVLKILKDRNDAQPGQPVGAINVYELEKALNTHPAIAKAEVDKNVNGEITIRITQRKPLVRIITLSGESYYIDNKATLMPLSDHYTARVLVVNGLITESYSQFFDFSIPQIEKDSALGRSTVLDDIYELAKYISSDSLLDNLIMQASINQEREIELFPSVGNQKIIFGNSSDMQEKFEKLKIFYKEGLNNINNWNKYSTINLKYRDQVVCTKK